MVEKDLELKLKTILSAMTELSGVEIITGREAANSGEVKGEEDVGAKALIEVTVGKRRHDNFTISTADISGSIRVWTRADLCPTGAEHETIVGVILDKLEDWHSDGAAFSAAVEIEGYYAAEIKIDGGEDKVFSDGLWAESVDFTIRGSMISQ